LYGFGKGSGTIACLFQLVGSIYNAFNRKGFLVTTFIDIRSAYDSVHISTLLSILLSPYLPHKIINFISTLLSKREFIFYAPSGSQLTLTTYMGLPQGSSLSPLLFNIYISFVSRALEKANVPHLIYADDIVVFQSHKNINLVTGLLNNSLYIYIYNNSLNFIHLLVSYTKSKVVIFTRKMN